MNSQVIQSPEAPIVAFKAALPPHTGRVFDMSQAVPNYPTFRPIVEQLKSDLDEPKTGFYTAVEGLPELRAEIAKQHPLSLEAKHIFITAGANQGMYAALGTLFSAGDTVTLLEPFYFNYEMALIMLGLRPDYFQLSAADGFDLDPQKLLSHLKAKKSKGVILITPNNPTGACYSADAIQSVAEGCSKAGVQLLVDETYAAFDSMHLRSQMPASAWKPYLDTNVSLVGSFSKAFSLTGYRVGYWAMPSACVPQALKLQDTQIICAPHLSQRAALVGLKKCGELVATKRQAIEEKRQVVREWFSSGRSFSLRSSGPFFAYLEHPWPELSAKDAALRLYRESGIVTLPGSAFGRSQERYLRAAYENVSIDDLRIAVTALG